MARVEYHPRCLAQGRRASHGPLGNGQRFWPLENVANDPIWEVRLGGSRVKDQAMVHGVVVMNRINEAKGPENCLGRTCLKWGSDGELTSLDMEAVLRRLADIDHDLAAALRPATTDGLQPDS